MLYNRNLVPLKFRLIADLISGTIIMILLPNIVFVMEKDSTANVVVTVDVVLIMDMVNALYLGGFFDLVSFFSNKFKGSFFSRKRFFNSYDEYNTIYRFWMY